MLESDVLLPIQYRPTSNPAARHSGFLLRQFVTQNA